jgi:heat shock protein HtpX
LWLSREREYSADETGARMAWNPEGLISALQKLGTYNNQIRTTAISPTTGALCIVKPMFVRETFANLFSTHPPLEDRIATLRELAGQLIR